MRAPEEKVQFYENWATQILNPWIKSDPQLQAVMRLIYTSNDLMDKNFVIWLKKLITIRAISSEPPSPATKLGLAWDMRMSESANSARMSAAAEAYADPRRIRWSTDPKLA
jgi:hypothetical protein